MREIRSSNEPVIKISRQQAMEITRKFLEQHHSVSNAKTVWKQDRWVVTMCVGMSKSDTRHVEIDAVTGRILGYT